MITSPTKPVELTASERHIVWIACRFLGMAKSTKDDERAVLNDVLDKIMKANGQENFEKRRAQN